MAKKRGMSLADQADLEARYERTKNALKGAAATARGNKEEGKRALTVVAGGAMAGAVDGYQQKATDAGEDSPLKLVEGVPTEAILGGALAVYGLTSKGKSAKMALDLGKGALAYAAGKMAKDKVMEMDE